MKDNVLDWKASTLMPWSKVQLTDGTIQRGGMVIRARVAGKWVYRAPTDKERDEDFWRLQW
jgi:hypothetical protein